MNPAQTTSSAGTPPGLGARPRIPGIGPVLTLLLLAPLVAEVLSGATRLSYIFVLVPEIMVWGVGALLAREATRRWQAGGRSLLLLGLALAIAEEIVIQQTSLAPYAWAGTSATYGRAVDVNWLWLLAMLGYESVWVVLAPVQITELLFPSRRVEPWLRRRGLAISGIVFIIGSFIAWFAWTQNARPKVFHVAKYQPPAWQLLMGVAVIALLILGAYKLRASRCGQHGQKTPSPWVVGLAAFILGLGWYVLIAIAYGAIPTLPIGIPLLGGSLWAGVAFLMIERWSACLNWQDGHRLALASGAVVACMVGGFGGSSLWPRIDLIGKVVMNLMAVILLVYLAIRQRNRSSRESS